MRFPRFQIRTLMIAVAAVAVTLAIVKERKRCAVRSGIYQRMAEGHDGTLHTLALIRREGYYPYCFNGRGTFPLYYDSRSAPLHARHVAYHTALKQKYERAARYPWLPVEPDPPAPPLLPHPPFTD